MSKKVYVITGATSGIGKAVAEKLSLDNIVFAGYRSESKAEDLKQISDNIYPFYVDYSKPETIKEAADFICSKSEKIDSLINIAGCVVAGPIEKININEIRRQFDVNVFGHIEMTQRLINKLENGRIINVSSMASYGIFPFISPYCVSKRALDMFFNSLLIENKHNLTIVSIKPGVISTPLWEKSIDENSKHIDDFKEYEKEMNYVLHNAEKNEKNGLDVQKVVEVILKADSVKHPKLSYTIGRDAFFARFISKLPQRVINKLVRFGIKMRMK